MPWCHLLALHYETSLRRFWISELKLFISDGIMDWGDDIWFQLRGKEESSTATKPKELMSSIWNNQIKIENTNNNQKQNLLGALSSSDGLMQSGNVSSVTNNNIWFVVVKVLYMTAQVSSESRSSTENICKKKN